MSASTYHIQSTRMNHSMLRSRGMQRIRNQERLSKHDVKFDYYIREPKSALASYHHERRMKKASARGVKKEIIGYLLSTVLLFVASLMVYGIFFS